jgi:2-polyprenyl-3-methyl-5-hydroxy-6-metoxy-1,4-benzoquinol methylase
MTIKIAGGIQERGIVVGNFYDKYGSRNPVLKSVMKGFGTALSDLVAKVSPRSIHDVGCGEGIWVIRWNENGIAARGSEFSSRVIEIARENAITRGLSPSLFEQRSIYDLDAVRDSADLLVCCEVLEHLEHPQAALQALQRAIGRHLIISVPREPLWRALNLARGKYIARFGNTPGHIQHWSKAGIVELVSQFFDVIEVRSPLPWTMLLCKRRG